ncbi:MAG: hypothetical protein ACLP9L_06715 [Thermoguttaceae bacterium]
MNVLNLIVGLWNKNGVAAQAPAVAHVPVIPNFAPTALEERQRLLAHHVRLVARGMANGLCVYGSRGGLGKTRVVLATLKEEGVEPVILTGHCTPLAMYLALYEHPESVVFLDDCDAMFRNLPALGIMRSALWEGEKGHRLVNYNSSQLKVPSSFHFTGRIIFAVNTLPRQNHAFSAVLSRVDQFELSASNEEVLVMLRRLAARGFEGKLMPDECMEVVDFIAEFSATRELSLRLFEPSLRKVLYAREAAVDWRQLVASQLHEIGYTAAPRTSDARDYDLECLKQVLEDYPGSVAEQEAAWLALTHRSRATFFRLKKSMGKVGDHIGTTQAAMGVIGSSGQAVLQPT